VGVIVLARPFGYAALPDGNFGCGIRRWIREGRLPATRVGDRNLVEDQDLRDAARRASGTVDLPPEWLKTFWGGPMPDFVGALRRSRRKH